MTQPQNQPPANPPAPGAPPAPGVGDKTFSQADIDRIIQQRVNESKQAEAQRIATELGCTVEEAKAKIKASNDADAARLTEAERREKAAADRETSAAARETKADQRQLDADITIALTAAGVTADLNDARALVRLRDITAQSDEAGIKAAVENVKAANPSMFGGAAPGTPPPTPGTSAPPPGRPHIPPGRPGQDGEEKARERYGEKAKLPAAAK